MTLNHVKIKHVSTPYIYGLNTGTDSESIRRKIKLEIYDYPHLQTRIMCRLQLIFPAMFRNLVLIFPLFILGVNPVQSAAKVTVQQSTSSGIVIQIENPLETPDDLRPIPLLIGLPSDDYPSIEITGTALKTIPSFTADTISSGVRWIQKQLYQGIHTATLEVGPGDGNGRAYSVLTLRINFSTSFTDAGRSYPIQSSLTQNILNWPIARRWVQTPKKQLNKSMSLPSGNWIKITVTEDGPTLITGQQLLDIASDMSSKNPQSFALFSGIKEGRSFSQSPNRPLPENLKEVAVYFPGEENGILDAEDTLIWYGHGPSGFDVNGSNIRYHQNLYFTENVYWLNIPDDNQHRGLRVSESNVSDPNAIQIASAPTYIHSEFDLFNPYESGLLWVQNAIQPGGSQTVSFTLEQLSSGSQNATLTIRMYGGNGSGATTYASHSISAVLNGTLTLGNLIWAGFSEKTAQFSISPSDLINGSNTLRLQNISGDPNSQPFYDAVTIKYYRDLKTGGAFDVYSPDGNTAYQFQFSSKQPSLVWDITKPAQPISLVVQNSNDGWTVTVPAIGDTLHHIQVFNPADCNLPSGITWIGPKSFHEFRNGQTYAEYIIIGPREFQQAAQPLIDKRNQALYAPIETVYDEFSGGCKDPMAIRFFIQWMRENWTGLPALRPMIFLLGDADYDYRNITGESHSLVPTIEIGLTSTRATDDRLASVYGNIPEVPLGRYPAHTIQDVTNYVDKILEMETNPIPGIWRQRITLVADDTERPEHLLSQVSTGKSHTINSEILAALVDPAVITDKLYMIEYPEVSDASSYGVVKPDATQALFDQIRAGTAIVHYIGHGSEHQWAQERLLFQDRGDVNAIETGMKLPLWIAGTCSWGHFDYVQNEAFSEELIRRPMDGASSIITTTRLITVSSNQYYTEQLFRSIFPDRRISRYPLGDILQSVKTGNSDGELFLLFGDPALRLPLAADSLSTLTVSQDTLKALAVADFSGSQNSISGAGTGIITLRDADRPVTRNYKFLNTDQSISFILPGPTLFRGQISFTGSQFSGAIRIPNDLSFSQQPGYLSFYCWGDGTPFSEAMGSTGGLFFTGGEPSQDRTGPRIQFETEAGRILGSGDHLFNGEDLVVRLSDPLGINLTGAIGHSIQVAFQDNDDFQDVTERFIYDLNSITTGTLPLFNGELHDGDILRIQAWDNANNPTTARLK
ncbi:MAG: hypothetical protein GXO90_09915, partial [FCB group bacterium]|nr:hypothetical protein [FCB group bacterium]